MRRLIVIAGLILSAMGAVSAQTPTAPIPGNLNYDSFQSLGVILNVTPIRPANCSTIVAGACTVTTRPAWAAQSAYNGCIVTVDTNSVRMAWGAAGVALTTTTGILLPVGTYWIGGRQNMLGMYFLSTSAAGSTLNLGCTRN